MKNIGSNDQANVYLNVLKRWWWLPVLFGIFSAGVTYAGTKALMKPEYGAGVTLQVQPLTPGVTTSQYQDANTVAQLMTSPPALQAAYAKLKGPALSDVKALYRTACVADSTDRFVTCSTTSRFYQAASSVLSTLAYKFIPWNRDQIAKSLQPEVNGYKNHIKSLNYQINQLKAERAATQSGTTQFVALSTQITGLQSSLNSFYQSLLQVQNQITNVAGRVSVSSPPSFKKEQVSPHPARNAILGFIVGIGIAAALIVLLEYLDDSFRSSDEIAEAAGLNLLGAVRRFDGPTEEMGMIAFTRPRSAMAEAYRVARANIQFTNVSGNLRVLVVTSARDGEGKTTTANNLATTFALAGKKVLLVDADLRRPGLTKMFNMKDQPGLSTALIEPGIDVIRRTDVTDMDVVPSGPIPPNPAELLGSEQMRDWIEDAARKYDLIVLDTPPILSVADTRIMATSADAVIMVVDPTTATRRMVRQARQAMEAVGARVLGVILNRDVMRGEGYYYNYYYYDKSGVGEGRTSETRR